MNSPLGELSNIGFQLAEALELDPISYSNLSLADSLIKEKLDSIYMIDSIYKSLPLSGYESTRLQLTQQLKELRNVATSILTNQGIQLGFLRDSLLLINASIQSSELPDVNRQTIYTIVDRYQELGDSVLHQNYSTIYNIAQLCPYEGGPSVYIARSLLKIINTSYEYYDDITCLQAGYFRLPKNNSAVSGTIKIVPNPANYNVDVYSQFANDNMGLVFIYNSLGECVYHSYTEAGIKLKSIDISNLLPGVYSVSIILSGKSHVEKLVIIN